MLTFDAPPAATPTSDAPAPEGHAVSAAQRGDRPHAVVIGAGFGGLAAAIRFGARGYRVTLLERLDRPGGRARVHAVPGPDGGRFIFDAGPTILTAPHLLEELWALRGRRLAEDVDLRALDPFYTIRYHDGETFTCGPSPEAMRAEVARLSPGDVAGYERYMAVSAEMYERGFVNLADKPFDTIWDMAEVLPDLTRLRADRSVHGLVAKHVRDERLRVGLSFHPLFVGGNPFSATSFYSMISHLERIGGVNFAMGGTGQVVNGMAKLIEDAGDEIRYGVEVERILTKRQGSKRGSKPQACGVALSTGESLHADVVVSNADAAWTYRRLLAPEDRRRWTNKKLDRAAYSMGLFVWYFGTTKRYEDVPHHMIVLGPRYRELLRDIFRRKTLAEDFSLYLHRPTATDPSMAPPGCDSFYALSPVPHLDAGVDWEQQAESYRLAIQQRLEETVLPGLSDHIGASLIASPLDFRRDLLSEKGAAFGLEPLLTQMAWFRPHNRSEDVERLYLVGAGTHPGAGVPGVLCSAKVLDKVAPHASALV
ncbi:MAG: phytoene desaturase [Rhodobacteraceae bacterium]|nr:phytoene desaturase [Paracoccaceae bacterium]